MFQHVFAIDPGDKSNGFCYFKYNDDERTANLEVMSNFDPKELTDMLKIVWGIAQVDKPKIWLVCENFRIDTKVRQAKFQWNEMEVIRTIGKVQMLAALLEVPLTLQEPGNVLPMGRRWVPFKVNKGHLDDKHAAFMHGAHFMMERMKWFPTVDSITLFGQEKL